MAKILQIGIIPHNMTLFKFICVQYQFHRQTLPIMKIDRGQIQFREYVSTGTEPYLLRALGLVPFGTWICFIAVTSLSENCVPDFQFRVSISASI